MINVLFIVFYFSLKEEEEEEVEAQQELSELVNYFQPVHFKGFDKAESMYS